MGLESIGHAIHRAGLGGTEQTRSDSPARTRDGANADAAPAPRLMTSGELQQYVAAARSLPSTREDRVAALRAAIAQGAYDVPIEALTERLAGHGG